MQLGRKLHELWHLRLSLGVCAGLALLAAFWSLAEVSVLPPGLKSRHLETSTAATSVLVDTPRSIVLDTGVTTSDYVSITNRALLIANVMASAPVREYIARRAGVPGSMIQISSPVTPDWPRPLDRPGQRRGTSEILRSPDGFRLGLRSNPTVPEIDVFATAPSPQAAARLANGAVQGAQDYLRASGAQQGVPYSSQVRLRQLGVAEGGTINSGANLRFAIVSFLVVFVTSSAAALFLARVRRGWRLADRAAAGQPAAQA